MVERGVGEAMKGADTKQQTLQIWDNYRNGVGSKQIAETMGLSRCVVRSALTRGRRKGALPPLKRTKNLRHLMQNLKLKNGTMGEVMQTLDERQREWVLAEASSIGCKTVSEYLIELVRDEYERESADD